MQRYIWSKLNNQQGRPLLLNILSKWELDNVWLSRYIHRKLIDRGIDFVARYEPGNLLGFRSNLCAKPVMFSCRKISLSSESRFFLQLRSSV